MTEADLQDLFDGAVEILAETLDPADARPYVLGLILLRRLSDQFEARARSIEAETGDHARAWDDPDEHPLYVPAGARWSRINATADDVGAVLNDACEKLEDCCPQNRRHLGGALRGIDFNDKKNLGDDLLLRLIQHFDPPLADGLDSPKTFGRAFTWLLNRYAEDEGKDAAKSSTPPEVNQLMVALLNLREGQKVCDPAMGMAGTLIACRDYLAEIGANPRNLSICGQDVSTANFALARMNLVAHGVLDTRLAREDVIRSPQFLDGGVLMKFDRAVSHPEFSRKNWGRAEAQNDGHHRFVAAVPPKRYGDLAFVQHIVATITSDGRAVVVMPHGVLFRGAPRQKKDGTFGRPGDECLIRKHLVNHDVIEAIIGVPPNLFYGSSIPACLIVLDRNKVVARRQKILFVHAAREYLEESARNYMRAEDIQRITDAVSAFQSVERYCYVAPHEEVARKGYTLNISRYVDVSDPVEAIDVTVEIRELRAVEARRVEAEDAMRACLKELGYDN